MYKLKLIIALILTILITGCSVSTKFTPPIKEPVVKSSQIYSKTPADQIWDEFSKQHDFNFPPQEPNLYLLYKSGLTHKDAYVRWYAANRIMEFIDDQRKEEIVKQLQVMQSDTSKQVQEAAKFSLSVINKNFDGDRFIKSPDGQKIAFVRFKDSNVMYDDGEVWLYEKESDAYFKAGKIDGGCINGMYWSPDSQKLCIDMYGRIWKDIAIMTGDMNSYHINYLNIAKYIYDHRKTLNYKMGQNQRPDPKAAFLEWSPDGKRILLSYQFTDDNFIEQSTYIIYNVINNEVEKVMKSKPVNAERPIMKKPQDFKW